MADDDIDALFALPLPEFTAARNELAKALRAGGDKAAAAEVKALRKPTTAAWAVNQVVRADLDGAAALCELGDRMREAQAGLLEGAGPAAVREATAARRTLLDRLTDAGAALVGDGQREAIRATFDAASLDPERLPSLLAGRLAETLDPPSSFGLIEVASSPAPVTPEPADEVETTPDPQPAERAQREADARRQEQARQQAEADARQREQARQRAEAAARADRLVHQAGAALQDAERRLAGAQERLAHARDGVERAEAAVEDARAALDQAEADRDRLGDL